MGIPPCVAATRHPDPARSPRVEPAGSVSLRRRDRRGDLWFLPRKRAATAKEERRGVLALDDVLATDEARLVALGASIGHHVVLSRKRHARARQRPLCSKYATFGFASPRLWRIGSSNVVPPRTVRRLSNAYPLKHCASDARAQAYHGRAMSEIGATLFEVIAIVVLCALVWSLPVRSRAERRQRTAGVRTPHYTH